jgi:hypothetical protein
MWNKEEFPKEWKEIINVPIHEKGISEFFSLQQKIHSIYNKLTIDFVWNVHKLQKLSHYTNHLTNFNIELTYQFILSSHSNHSIHIQ